MNNYQLKPPSQANGTVYSKIFSRLQFSDWTVYSKIFSCFHYSDLLKLSMVNKMYHQMVEIYELVRRVTLRGERGVIDRHLSLYNYVKRDAIELSAKMNQKGKGSCEFIYVYADRDKDADSTKDADLRAKNADLPLDMLTACRFGVVHRIQFGTFSLFRSIWQQSPSGQKPMCLSLVKVNGQIDPLAASMIRSTFAACNRCKKPFTRKQFDLFSENMRKQPLSEQQFLCVRKNAHFSWSIVQAIHDLGMNAFGECNTKWMIVPSMGMMQTFLNVRYKNAVFLNPVLGSSDENDRYLNARNGRCDISIPFPGISLPDQIEGYIASTPYFTLYGFYRGQIISSVPQRFRYWMAMYSLELASEPSLKNLRSEIVNLECPEFRRRDFANARFWQSIALTITEEVEDPANYNLPVHKLFDCFSRGNYPYPLPGFHGLVQVIDYYSKKVHDPDNANIIYLLNLMQKESQSRNVWVMEKQRKTITLCKSRNHCSCS